MALAADSARTSTNGRDFTRPSEIPDLRPGDPFEPDPEKDGDRASYVLHLWHSQDNLLRQRDRQVEENLRMLLGQQWIVWSELRKQYVDLSELIPEDERKWRQLPVLNALIRWYQMTHARLTENPPVLTWQAGPDRMDALLAEVCDPIFKHWWNETGMIEVIDWLMSWMVPAGAAGLKSRIDPMMGEPVPMQGPATLDLLDAQTGSPILGADGEPIRREFDQVPLNDQGMPNARALWDGQAATLDPGDPASFLEGGLAVDVLSCLEYRGEWGHQKPWHKKDWHIHRSFLSPEQAYNAFGVELEPDVTGQVAEDVGLLQRLLYGSGLFGAAEQAERAQVNQVDGAQSFVSVYELWHRPSRRYPRSQDDPGGRLCIVTGGKKVIRDGRRPVHFKYTSPIRNFDFLRLPGRPSGTSPQEALNGPARTRNRFYGQYFQHASKVANPATILDSSQIDLADWSNQPALVVAADRRKGEGRPVAEYVQPPQLGREVGESIDRLTGEIEVMSTLEGSEGTPPTTDSSGELVKELRFNSDRPIAPTLRRATIELARLAEDWMALIPIVWDEERVIQAAGDDNIARTVTVYPELFRQGSVNVVPELESMLPEGRGERQARVHRMYQEGMFGMPGTPEAVNVYLDLARFPHMARAARPGGIDRTMAEQNVGKLLQGVPAAQVPILPWYDVGIHLWVTERFMKSPEYLKLDVPVQQEFVNHWNLLREAQLHIAALESAQMAAVEGTAVSSQLEAGAQIAESQGIDPGMGPDAAPPPDQAREGAA